MQQVRFMKVFFYIISKSFFPINSNFSVCFFCIRICSLELSQKSIKLKKEILDSLSRKTRKSSKKLKNKRSTFNYRFSNTTNQPDMQSSKLTKSQFVLINCDFSGPVSNLDFQKTKKKAFRSTKPPVFLTFRTPLVVR